MVLTDTRVSVLSFGFLTGAGFFSLDLTVRAEANLYYPGDLARLVLEGADEGGVYNMDGMGPELSGFDEIALGWSKAFGSKWQVGVRAKALFGFGNLNVTRSEFEIRTSEDLWSIASDMELYASLPFAEVIYDDEGMIEDIIIEDELSSTRPASIFN